MPVRSESPYSLLAFFVLLTITLLEEQLGLNLLIFSSLLLAASLYAHGRPQRNAWVAAGFTLLSGVMVVCTIPS
jgi:hypothetical protein